jgi:hypothetical protein
MQCALCGKETTNPRFCSRACAAKLTNRENPKRRLTKTCTKCDNVVRSYRSTLCENHFKEYSERYKNDMTIGEYRNKTSVKGKHPSWIHSHIRNFARSWLSEMRNLPCAKCGYNLHVELAHIKAVSEFNDDTKLSEVNSKSNVIQLCPNCHWEFDNLPRDGIFTKLLEELGKLN